MSYAAEELRVDIVEMFDAASDMSRYRVDLGELPARMRPTLPIEERDERRARREEQEAHRASLATVREFRPWPYYRCSFCNSGAPGHRCPKEKLNPSEDQGDRT